MMRRSAVEGATAERIRAVALELFAARGYGGVSMADIRREAGVSNGSVYHHAHTRADLAAGLLAAAMGALQDRTLARVAAGGADSGPPVREVVRGVVRDQLVWVERHREQARLVFHELPDEVLLAAEPGLSARNRAYVVAVRGWLERRMATGVLVPRPFGVAHALWVGPAQDFCRHWLHGRSRQAPGQAAEDLADGAWAALAAR